MKTRRFTQIRDVTCAGLLALTSAGLLGFGAEAHAGGAKFEGTWLARVRIVTCPPAPHAVIATFQTMTTYVHGGALIEGGGPSPPPPAVSRSAGQGIWERTGGHTYRSFFRSHSFDNLGRLVRTTEVKAAAELIKGDDPETPEVEPYYLSSEGTNTITNINPVDGSVISATQGCNEATALPFLFED